MEAVMILPVHGEGDHAQHGGGGVPRRNTPSVRASRCHLPVPGRIA